MPSEFYATFGCIKDVEREYLALRLAADHLMETAEANPAILASVQIQDLREASERLEGTYIIRLFAEFESSLRSFWARSRSTQPKTRDLIDGVAALAGVSTADNAAAHAVRLFRNSLIHERMDEIPAISMAVARGHLCRFFKHLSMRWK